MSSVDIITEHLKRIAARCTLDGTKAQIGAMLKHSQNTIINYIEDPDSFYHQHISVFDQMLGSSFDYLCLNEYRAENFNALLVDSTHWTKTYSTVHTWLTKLLDGVKTQSLTDTADTTEEEKHKQTHWLKFCVLREKLKRLDLPAVMNLWSTTSHGDVAPLIPVLKTVVEGMGGEHREYMETLFMMRPILFMELFEMQEHENIIYQIIEMIKMIFDIPRVYSLNCLDECMAATGLSMKELFDAILQEGQKYMLATSASGSAPSTGLSDLFSPEGTKMMAQVHRLSQNKDLAKRRAERWVNDSSSVGGIVWRVLKPKMEQIGFTWDKMTSGVEGNFADIIAPRLTEFYRSYKRSQNPETQQKLSAMINKVRAEFQSKPEEDFRMAGLDEKQAAEAKQKLNELLNSTFV